jgi:pantetheine-phosphate adenylyltransferase
MSARSASSLRLLIGSALDARTVVVISGPPAIGKTTLAGPLATTSNPEVERALGPAGKTRRVATALYPGSFDPLHLGHFSVIERATAIFEQVVVAVVGNPDKASGLFDIATRIELIRAATGHMETVSCVGHRGLTVDAAQLLDSPVIVRTGHKDADDEWAMLAMNQLMTGVRTAFVPPDPTVMHLSSSLVRSLVACGRVADACRLVPPAVATALSAVA